jgi:nucleolar pre-ribosomal-associated protein 1
MDTVKSNLASNGNIQVSTNVPISFQDMSPHLFQSIFALPWIRFLEPSDLFSLLSFVSNSVNNTSGAPALELLEAILAALRTSIIPSHESVGQRLTELLELRGLLPNSPTLGDVIAATVNTCLPVAHHGRLSDGPIWDASSLETSTTLAEMRWNRHLDPLPEEIDLQTFLEQKPWIGPTARTVSDLLYKQPSSREAYLHWLGTDYHTSVATCDLAMTLYAYLDAAIQQDDVLVDAESEILASQFRHLLSSNWMEPSHGVSFGVACLILIIKRSGSKSTDLLSSLLRHIQDISNDLLCSEHLVLGRRLCKLFNHEAEEIVTCIVDRSLQRVVRIFSNGATELEDALKFTNELGASITL